MVRRIPRGLGYADEPAHTFRPCRLAGEWVFTRSQI
jgi:hypothetical protein